MHVLVVGQHHVSLGLEEVDVQDAQDGQQDGQVALQGSAAEVVVLEKRRGQRQNISRFEDVCPL